jgi:phosphatidylglycerophosphate synthase
MAMTSGHTGVHARENLSWLAGPEKQLLIWIAQRLPASVNSDHLSGLALAAMAATGIFFALYPVTRWAAVGVVGALIVNWFGDSLDGTLARVRQQQRPRYGYYVDHVIDLAGSAALFAGMACSGLMTPLISLIVLTAYLLVFAESFLATHAAGTFRMSFLGWGPTELRILLAVGAVRAAVAPWLSLGDGLSIRLFDLGGCIAAAGLLVAFTASSIRNARALYRAEPLPVRSEESRVA